MKELYNGNHLGFSQHLSTVDRRSGGISRSYAATGDLELCHKRPNLRILTKATVSEIILDTRLIRARGVKSFHGGRRHAVFTQREVIVAPSTIQSPRLLELSGIGDPQMLRAAGVPCRINLPYVGKNLQEHPLSCVTYELTKTSDHVLLDSAIANPDVLEANGKRPRETQDGLCPALPVLSALFRTHRRLL